MEKQIVKISNLSLSGKIIGLVILTVLMVGGATFGSSFFFLSKGYDEQAERDIAVRKSPPRPQGS